MNDNAHDATNPQPGNPVLLQPDNHNKRYEALFVEIDSGQIKLPRFQREFVWEKEQSAKLIDSILKGFPIGTFIFWKTKEELRSYKEVGNHKLPETPKGDYVQYILDGQQRITSLYAIRKGIRITKDGKELDYKDIFIDMDYKPATDEQIVVTETLDGKQYVSVHDVLSKPLGTFYRTLSHEQADRVEAYKTKLTNYDFSTITIKDYPIEVACEVFSRINTSGKSLTVFEIMVAKTYDETKGFDLADKYEVLRDGSDEEKECLDAAKFETLPEAIIMQCVAAITLRAVRSRDILKIRREAFIDKWEPMKTALFMAIDFIRSELRVPVSQLVPYPAAVVPLTYFFHATGNKKPSNEQVRLLEQFFYWVGLTQRYGSATESKLSEDFNKMDEIAKGNMPSYQSNELTINARVIAETWFSAGNAYCKAILCLLAYQQPKSFDTNGMVILDNSNLKIAASRNYHHFFPKKYLEDNQKGKQPNLIANITLIDGYSNKHRIGKKAPSEYIGKFAKGNKSLPETLQTHLIMDMDAYGVPSDDYDRFIQQRAKAIALALNVKLMSMTPAQAADAQKNLEGAINVKVDPSHDQTPEEVEDTDDEDTTNDDSGRETSKQREEVVRLKREALSKLSPLELMQLYLNAPPNKDGQTPAQRYEEVDKDRATVIDGQLQPLVKTYLAGGMPLEDFKVTIDRINRKHQRWGFKGIKGQMFFNMVVNVAGDAAECDQELKAAIAAPANEDMARSRIQRFASYVLRIGEAHVKDGGGKQGRPKTSSIPFFLSYFWQVQDRRNWPIYYTNAVKTMSAVGLWQPSDDLAENYIAFKHLYEELAQSFTKASEKPFDLYGVEHVFWFVGAHPFED